MKKKDETRYFVTSVASVPVYKVASKTEMYRMATKPGWGAVEWYSAADGYKNRAKRCARQRANSIAQSLDNFFQRSKYLWNPRFRIFFQICSIGFMAPLPPAKELPPRR